MSRLTPWARVLRPVWCAGNKHRGSIRLNEVLIDRYQDGKNPGYPTLCKGRYLVDGERYHALEEPTSLDTLELLPELMAANMLR